MSGIIDIQVLLKQMKPILDNAEYVFISKKCFKLNQEIVSLNPIATFLEAEGMTAVILKSDAVKNKLTYDAVFRKITLEVHSSLEAVGLTAAISTALTERDISANVIAGYYHDHIFVLKNKAELALDTLEGLTR